jgi:glycosyltransferase involved in cell wall biosynthesis
MVLAEAMAAGTPVVATAVGGIPEVLEEGRAGRLVPYGDPGALADALRAVVRDPETTRRLVARGRTRVAGLDWSECARRHLELYRSLESG